MCTTVTSPTFFAQLASACTRLETLYLQDVKVGEGISLSALASGLPALKELHVLEVDPGLFEGQADLLARITHLITSDGGQQVPED